MTITFACGHKATVSREISDRPRCPQCAETRISHVDAPPPTFRGVATGPLCVKG